MNPVHKYYALENSFVQGFKSLGIDTYVRKVILRKSFPRLLWRLVPSKMLLFLRMHSFFFDLVRQIFSIASK